MEFGSQAIHEIIINVIFNVFSLPKLYQTNKEDFDCVVLTDFEQNYSELHLYIITASKSEIEKSQDFIY